MKVTQSCLALCDPMECTVLGILQARILEWVAFLFSKGSSQPRDQTQGSCILYQLSHKEINFYFDIFGDRKFTTPLRFNGLVDHLDYFSCEVSSSKYLHNCHLINYFSLVICRKCFIFQIWALNLLYLLWIIHTFLMMPLDNSS